MLLVVALSAAEDRLTVGGLLTAAAPAWRGSNLKVKRQPADTARSKFDQQKQLIIIIYALIIHHHSCTFDLRSWHERSEACICLGPFRQMGCICWCIEV